jgi:glycosyltransferase involved in cell wall biosynthesis
MAQELVARCERERLANVRFARNVDLQTLREEYRQADIFLFPSRWEGSPKVILEAAACGLPVIACKDYEPETVLDGITGYVVGSTEELFQRLTALIVSPALREALSRGAREHAERYDWDRIVKRWEEVFLKIAGTAAPCEL